MRPLLLLLPILASLATAVEITFPVANSTLVAGGETKVVWSSVDTDPTTLSLYLVNFVNWPPSYVPLAIDVDTADGSHQVKIPCDTPASSGYQINAINGTNVYVIYAQSKKFSVGPALDPAGCIDEKPSVAAECPVATPTTVFVTVSTAASTNSSRTLPSPLYPTTSSTSSHPPFTSPGVVPKTIGWCSGYEHPVTLVEVPKPASATSATMAVTPLDHILPQETNGVVTLTTWVTAVC
jgi:hypothetical protein